MNLLLRILLLALRLPFRSRIGLLDASTLRLRTLPNDLDLNLHMNNGRFLSIMDLGRMDLLGRIGIVRVALKRKWAPIVGSAVIRYLRPLPPFVRFELTSRVLCWDEKWFYMEQRFDCRGKPAAIAYVKGLLRGPGGNVPSADVLRAIGSDLVSPAAPDVVVRWIELERSGAPENLQRPEGTGDGNSSLRNVRE